MKIAITGAGGLVGSHLAQHLTPRHQVLALKHRDLDISDPVRQVGSYQVTARLHRAVNATVTIEVRAVGGA